MALTLSVADLEQVGQATRLLTSPLDFAHVDAWRAAVNRHLRVLFGADTTGFLLPVEDGLMLFSEDYDPAELAQYPEVVPPDAGGRPAWLRAIEMEVSTLETLYGPELGRYLGSTYYQEFALPRGGGDTLAASLSLGGADPARMAMLQYWRADPDGPGFGERELALLRLLFPAFRAGVASWARWSRHADDLLHTLDGLGQAALICARDGRVQHVTPALQRLLDDPAEAPALRRGLQATVRALRRLGPGRGKARRGAVDEDGPVRLAREVRGASGRYELTGCVYRGPGAGAEGHLLVGVAAAHAPVPAAAALRERFGLTRRQAEVARLLAVRRSNQEIAEALSISAHTARHHVEHVLRRLGVPRTEVGATLQQAAG